MQRAALALALLAAAPPAAADPALSPAELRAELTGAPILWWEAEGWRRGSLYLAPDGAAEIGLDGPAPATDTGRWRLDGDRLCTVWTTLRGGEERCYRVERAGAGRFATSGGNLFEVLAPGA
jgi:hypothetical protein